MAFVSLVIYLGGAAVAVHRGGLPEKITAAIVAFWIFADVSYHQLYGPSDFDSVDPVHLVLDGGELVAIMGLALRANRMWPLWAAAAQLICVSGHVAIYIDAAGMRRAYWAITQLPPYIQIVALVLGSVAHARRFERIGPYRSWRSA